MAPTTHPFECTYLHSQTLPTPHTSSDHAELVLITERISSLDRHISELNTLRRALHYRSRQLHNRFSPIYALPIEVLSRIFEQLIVCPQDSHMKFHQYRACLSQAFALGSVSAHFRDVALGTPELWKRIPLRVNRRAIGRALSMLQYCMALAASINISVLDEFDQLEREEARSAMNILLTPYTTPKIKVFELYMSSLASETWIKKLKTSPSSMLDALKINCPLGRRLDVGVFENVTRLVLRGPCSNHSLTVIAPPSLQYLIAYDLPQRALISLLYQSPNLVECSVAVPDYRLDDDAVFNEPLTLSHLKRLTLWGTVRAITSSPQIPLLPSLESLSLEVDAGIELTGVVLLCRNVPATLTTLKIHIRSNTVELDDLHQLWEIPFPNLRELVLYSSHQEPLLNAIRALKIRVDECSNAEPHYLPSMTALILRSSSTIEPRWVLDLLSNWKISGTGHLDVKVKYPSEDLQDWSTELREELGSIVGGSQIDVTWGNSKVLPLSRRTDSRSQQSIVD